jgi:endonuclease I
MRYLFSFLLFLLIHPFLSAQLVINELDSDTAGSDLLEFIELKSEVPYFPLDGYVIVFFNGSDSGGNASYYTIDLDGYTTDLNNIFMIGSINLSPVPQMIIPANVIQNGADAVAVYLGSDTDFPLMTVATQVNLIDALMYDTSDADDTELMALLGETIQYDENANGLKDSQSIQRDNTGNYYTANPTPRMPNDGSGTVLNGVRFTLTQTQYIEGESFQINVTTEQPVTADLNLHFNITTTGFTTADFTGNLDILIPNGSNAGSTTILLVDDTLDEGDVETTIRLSALPEPNLILNNNYKIRIVDNDYSVANFGTPINPTHGLVASTQVADYYDSLDGLSGAELRQSLQDIIANPAVVRAQTYADIVDMLKEADQNPENSNQVWLVYLEIGRAKLDYQTVSSSVGLWNREHTFPRSRAGYDSIEADETADGKNVYWTTNADSLRHGNSDGHGLRAVDGPENSSRGNQHYGEYNGPVGTLGGFKGDVARSVFYLAVRYNGLEIVNGFPDITGQLGDLLTLLNWHRNDPPDDYEMNRNNIIFDWQKNRNPFIDHPALVEYIWGNEVGQVWNQNLSVSETEKRIFLFPNPTHNTIYVAGLQSETKIELYASDGRLLNVYHLQQDAGIDLEVQPGLYTLKISSSDFTSNQLILVE